MADGKASSMVILESVLIVMSLELRVLSERQKVPVDLDMYIKKLANSRRRILLVNDILQNVQVLVPYHKLKV